MSENDVFDEELMKELGLDPTEFDEGQAASKPKPKQATPPPGARAQRGATAGMPQTPGAQQRPQPPQRPAPRPAAAPASQVAKTIDAPKKTTSDQPFNSAQGNRPPTSDKQPGEPKAVSGEAQAKKISNDLPIQLAAVMAKKTLRLGDILGMNVGEVIEFKKPHTEPIDLVANGKLVAKAELVVVEGKLGARIIKIVR
jgi:flagellar motor switch protein FliN